MLTKSDSDVVFVGKLYLCTLNQGTPLKYVEKSFDFRILVGGLSLVK